MSDEPVYFGVVTRHGQETPRLFFDIVPSTLLRKNSPLVYCTRLDLFPNADRLIHAPLADLMRVYLALRAKGKAPPDDRGIKPRTPAPQAALPSGS